MTILNSTLKITIISLVVLMVCGCKKDELNNLPSCHIIFPLDSQEFNRTDTIIILVDAVDDNGQLFEVRYYIDDVGKGSSKKSPFQYNWDTSNDSLGFHTIKAKSYNIDGESNFDEITVIIKDGGIQCPNSFVDVRDGKSYRAVLIGNQCWMAENLNVGIRIDGGDGQLQTDNGIIEKYCYNDNDSNCIVYGGLYEWNEIMDYYPSDNGNPGTTKGICPVDWHLPSDIEWKVLADSLGGVGLAGGKMKENGTSYWKPPNSGATNSSGFTALPGGRGNYFSGVYGTQGFRCNFWSSTQYSNSWAWSRNLFHDTQSIVRIKYIKGESFSVRCIKN